MTILTGKELALALAALGEGMSAGDRVNELEDVAGDLGYTSEDVYRTMSVQLAINDRLCGLAVRQRGECGCFSCERHERVGELEQSMRERWKP